MGLIKVCSHIGANGEPLINIASQLRKKNKLFILNQKRVIPQTNEFSISTSNLNPTKLETINIYGSDFDKNITIIKDSLNAYTDEQKVIAFCYLRYHFCNSQQMSPTLIIKHDLIPVIVKYINYPIDSIAYNVSWILINFVDSNQPYDRGQCQSIMFIEVCNLLKRDLQLLKESALMLLSNMSIDDIAVRDQLICNGWPKTIIQYVNTTIVTMKFLEATLRFLLNLCQGNPAPCNLLYYNMPAFLIKTLEHSNVEIVSLVLKIMSCISGTYDREAISFMMNRPIINKVVCLLDTEIFEYQETANRIIGNICYLDDGIIPVVIECNYLVSIKRLLVYYTMVEIVKGYLWSLSNIATCQQCADYIVEMGLAEITLKLLIENEQKIKIECIYVICNLIETCSYEKVKHIVDIGGVRILLSNVPYENLDATGQIISEITNLGRLYMTNHNYSEISQNLITNGLEKVLEETISKCDKDSTLYKEAKLLLSTYFFKNESLMEEEIEYI